MKLANIFSCIFVCCLTIACTNKIANLKFEKSLNSPNNLKPYILDYTFADNGGNKDTLIINAPITFHIKNNSNDKFVYQSVIESGYRYIPYVIINKKKYNANAIIDLQEKIYVNQKETSEITYFFQTPILKKTLEEELGIKEQLNDSKLGDSIIIYRITPKIQEEIDENSRKDLFTITLKNINNDKTIGIRYCFNNNKTVIHDVDSLLKANPKYMFSCEKDFYKKERK